MQLESLRAEQALHKLSAGLSAGLFGLLLAIWLVSGGALLGRLLLLASVSGGYFAGMFVLYARGYGRAAPRMRWLGAAVEPTLVTAGLVVTAVTAGAEAAATSSLFLLYSVVVALAACRMRPRFVLLAASMCVVQYLAAYYLCMWPELAGAGSLAEAARPLVAWQRVLWLSLSSLLLAAATLHMRGLAKAGGTESWRRKRLVDELSRYVSPDVAQAILRADGGALIAERREVTVLFCDVRGFTELCEQEAPESVVGFLNEFFGRACEIVSQHGGTVNKFLGDGLLVLFGAPEEHPVHAQAAAEAAHEILYAVDELRERGGLWAHLDVGIGIDTGLVVCGSVGARDRLEYTAVGSIVNRAARLQGLSREAGHRIVLSRDCVKQLGPRANVVSCGKVKLKGFTDPVPVFAFRHS